jgi:hypothetical protein
MRRLSVLVLLVLTLTLVIDVAPASARILTGADLEADCNDDGKLPITETTVYSGGTALLTQDCFVSIAGGASLTLTKLVLLSKCCGFIVNESGPKTSVSVLDSTVDLIGPLQLAAGCCSGDPGEENGLVRIERSNVRASTIEGVASVGSPNGGVLVSRSRLEATESTFSSIRLRASFGALGDATRGRVHVANSQLVTGGDVTIQTGPNGHTSAIDNTFTVGGTVVITTGPRGTCVSIRNVPAVPCS